MFQDGLHQFLAAQAGLATLLGAPTRGDKTDGIFPMLAIAQAILPYITFTRVTGVPTFSLAGADALNHARFRFSCYGSSQRQAVLVANEVKSVFKTWTGTFPDGTVVQNVMLEMEADDAEPAPKGTIYATHLDFLFMYVES